MAGMVRNENQRRRRTRVAEVCNLIHFFRVGLVKAIPGGGSAAALMSFAGCWSDMPEEQFASLATEWQERRHGAFARRRDHEADAAQPAPELLQPEDARLGGAQHEDGVQRSGVAARPRRPSGALKSAAYPYSVNPC